MRASLGKHDHSPAGVAQVWINGLNKVCVEKTVTRGVINKCSFLTLFHVSNNRRLEIHISYAKQYCNHN